MKMDELEFKGDVIFLENHIKWFVSTIIDEILKDKSGTIVYKDCHPISNHFCKD